MPFKPICLLLLAISKIAFSQEAIRVQSSQDSTAIPYITASFIKNDSIVDGVYANLNGMFLPTKTEFDKIIISGKGYESKTISPDQMDSVVVLDKRSIQLENVIVPSDKVKILKVGDFLKKERVFVSAQRGFEIADTFLIDSSQSYQIKSFHFYIKRFTSKQRAIVRLHFYSVFSENPDSLLNPTDIIVKIEAKDKGEITVPLYLNNVRVSGKFAVGIEWMGQIDENGNFLNDDGYNDCAIGYNVLNGDNVTQPFIRNTLKDNLWRKFIPIFSDNANQFAPAMWLELR